MVHTDLHVWHLRVWHLVHQRRHTDKTTLVLHTHTLPAVPALQYVEEIGILQSVHKILIISAAHVSLTWLTQSYTTAHKLITDTYWER